MNDIIYITDLYKELLNFLLIKDIIRLSLLNKKIFNITNQYGIWNYLIGNRILFNEDEIKNNPQEFICNKVKICKSCNYFYLKNEDIKMIEKSGYIDFCEDCFSILTLY